MSSKAKIVPAIHAPEGHFEDRKRIHTCSICRRKDTWGPTWSWFGSIKEEEDGKPVPKFCSDECKARHPHSR